MDYKGLQGAIREDNGLQGAIGGGYKRDQGLQGDIGGAIREDNGAARGPCSHGASEARCPAPWPAPRSRRARSCSTLCAPPR